MVAVTCVSVMACVSLMTRVTFVTRVSLMTSVIAVILVTGMPMSGQIPMVVVVRQPGLTTRMAMLGLAHKVVLLVALAFVGWTVALPARIVVAAAHRLLAGMSFTVVASV